MLARHVRDILPEPHEPAHTGDVDDRAALCPLANVVLGDGDAVPRRREGVLLFHNLELFSGTEERAALIYVDDFVPLR